MLTLGERRGPGEWRPPVVTTVASREEGLDELVAALEKHRGWLEETGELRVRRRARAGDEIEAIALTTLRERMGDLRGGSRLAELAEQVVAGTSDPFTSAGQLVEEIARAPYDERSGAVTA